MAPDTRAHRGAHPQDPLLFSPPAQERMAIAVHELSWLLSRGYPDTASLKLVGDRHKLKKRQREAVGRAACSDAARDGRRASRRELLDISGDRLMIDGFNILITVEAALSGAVVLVCRDGVYRDLSSVHGSYRSVEETDRALHLIGKCLAPAQLVCVEWALDRPVSNSGRLAKRIEALAEKEDWPWKVTLKNNPDRYMMRDHATVATGDSVVLNAVDAWVDVVGEVLMLWEKAIWTVDLSGRV